MINPCKYIGTPSYAKAIFSSNFCNKRLEINNGEIETFVRKSYFGGRTEIFKPHILKGYMSDINSSYPNAMLKTMPDGAAV
jgi:hypothetical protein